MRRVNLYKLKFGYVKPNVWGLYEEELTLAHEEPESVIWFIRTHRDYPGCEIRQLTLVSSNILVPERGKYVD
jgi:hypothetical protein